MEILRNGGRIRSGAVFINLVNNLYPAVALYDKDDEVTLVDYKVQRPTNTMMFMNHKNHKVVLSVSREACSPFGFYPGDEVMCSSEKTIGTVVGVSIAPTPGILYIHIPDKHGLVA